MIAELVNTVSLVTDGSAGFDLGVAKRFAEEDARVFITGRRPAELDKAITSIGGNTVPVRADVSDLADLDRILAPIQAQAGRIDVLVANAGFYEFGALGEITAEHFDKTFNMNVRGLLFTVQKALPPLGRGSSVILTGSRWCRSRASPPARSITRQRRSCARSSAPGSSISRGGTSVYSLRATKQRRVHGNDSR